MAWEVCNAGWGKLKQQNGNPPRPFDPSIWHAKTVTDHWHVWTGTEKSPGYQVNVPLTGGTLKPETDCDLTFYD